MICPLVSLMVDIRLPLTATVDVRPSPPPNIRFMMPPMKPSNFIVVFSRVLTSAKTWDA